MKQNWSDKEHIAMGMSDDEIVSDYLRRLEAAASGLPADRRHELIEEITTHIAEARSASPHQITDVRTILDQLGAPEEIVRAADPIGAAASSRSAMPDRLGWMEILTVVLLLVGGIVLPVIGWVVGVVLLWSSPRWGSRDKLLGTLIWPGGLLASVVVLAVLAGAALFTTQVCYLSSTGNVCSGPSLSPWLSIPLAVIAIVASVVGPIWVAIRLVRHARESLVAAAEPPQDLLVSPLSA